jgi:RHS repeat-associated protein
VGNRTSQTASGATTNYTYASTSQRLASTSAAQIASFGYDAMGNTTSVTGYGAANFTFDGKGRMSSAAAGGVQTNYKVNASGQRVLKIGPTSSTVYAYDERGRLIGEYDANGTLKQETAWLDDLPAATLRPTGVYYVHADHLGTPRFVTEPASRVVRWQWTGDPFGVAAPNENPASAGAFSYNLRFPGQMFDAETILNYNWHRDYNPNVGRYTQSDPIGLRGGLNTYAYVTANPIVGLDMSGLANGSAAQMWMKGRPNCLRGPDFVNFQIDMYVGSVSGTFSRDGNSFLGFGVNRGYANPVSLSASVSIGWLNSSALSPGQTNSFLRGFSGGGATMYSGVGGGIAISPGNGTATVIGIGAGMSVGGTSVGSAGLGLGYGVEQGRTGLSWGSGSCTCN